MNHFDITALFKNMWILKFKSQLTSVFSLLSIILADLLGNRSLLQRAQKVMDCKLWISIHFVCFSVPRFVACHHNYNRQQQKTHLWWTSERVFLKSAVKENQGFVIFSMAHRIYWPIKYCTLYIIVVFLKVSDPCKKVDLNAQKLPKFGKDSFFSRY